MQAQEGHNTLRLAHLLGEMSESLTEPWGEHSLGKRCWTILAVTPDAFCINSLQLERREWPYASLGAPAWPVSKAIWFGVL